MANDNESSAPVVVVQDKADADRADAGAVTSPLREGRNLCAMASQVE